MSTSYKLTFQMTVIKHKFYLFLGGSPTILTPERRSPATIIDLPTHPGLEITRSTFQQVCSSSHGHNLFTIRFSLLVFKSNYLVFAYLLKTLQLSDGDHAPWMSGDKPVKQQQQPSSHVRPRSWGQQCTKWRREGCAGSRPDPPPLHHVQQAVHQGRWSQETFEE